MSRAMRLVAVGASTAVVAGTAVVGPASGLNTTGPDNETIWEYGTVTSVGDGDTITANLTSGPLAGERRIRTVGVQAPEVAHGSTPADCGADESTNRLKAQLPVGAQVQTRAVASWSNDDYSGGRIVRSLYAQDEEGNWYDTSRSSVSSGWLLWFPLAADSGNKPEWAHNLEYRVLADDAVGQGRGLWTANLCGAAPSGGANLRVWGKYDGTEKVYVENNSAFPVDLSGWTVRDSALNGYRILPAGTVVPAGEVREVYTGDLNLNNLPAENSAFEGDAVFLLDNAGSLKTGNLRAWFPYPCNPDNCTDPLAGTVKVTAVQKAQPDLRRPSAPGSVAAVATNAADPTSATGGSAVVTWEAPKDLGGPAVSYTVTAATTDGGPVPAPVTGINALSTTVTGLAVGRPYTFTVTAVNASNPALASDPSAPSGAVTPIGIPGIPVNVVVESRSASSVTVSWTAPPSTGGRATTSPYAPDLTYTAFDSGDPTKKCQTTDGATSCVITGLAAGPHTFAVRAANNLGTSADSTPSGSITPTNYTPGAPDTKPDPPTAVLSSPQDGRAIVSWTAPVVDGGNQIEGYTAKAVGGTPAQQCTTTAATSCVVPSLINGTAYTFVVTANNSKGTSNESGPSTPAVRPYTYVAEQGPDAGSAPPAAAPWFPGQYVDITNSGSGIAHLGGYGLWNTASSNYNSSGKLEDRAAYLLDPATKLPAGGILRIYFGPATALVPDGVTVVHGGTSNLLDPINDFVQLANLNRAQLSCDQWGAGQCKQTSQLSLSSSPVGITARTTPSTVTVSWGSPISRGGQAITGYTAIAYNAPVGGTAIGSCATDGAGSSCSFPGSVGVKYYAEVTATNASGTSAPSWRVLATPKTVPASPGGVTVAAGKGQVAVSWTAGSDNGAPISKFTARAYAAGTGGGAVGSCTATAGSCTINGLGKGVTYFVDVTATNRVGEGPASSPRVAATTTGSTTAVTTYSKSKVTVRWVKVPGVTSYQAAVYDAPAGGKLLGKCTGKATASKCTTKKVKKKKLYYIDLTMVSPAGAQTMTPRIVTGPAKKASPPTAVAATVSATNVSISWDDPAFNGYSILKSYSGRVYSKASGGKVLAKCSATGTRYGCTTKATKKLKKGKTYWATAAVKNSKGWSKYATPRVPITIP